MQVSPSSSLIFLAGASSAVGSVLKNWARGLQGGPSVGVEAKNFGANHFMFETKLFLIETKLLDFTLKKVAVRVELGIMVGDDPRSLFLGQLFVEPTLSIHL